MLSASLSVMTVIDIHNQIDAALWSMMVKYIVIAFTQNHAKLLNYSRESTKPSSKRLLKAIKRFTKATNKARRIPMSNKSRRLLHIDFFFKVTTEEGILDVKLMKRPMSHSSHR